MNDSIDEYLLAGRGRLKEHWLNQAEDSFRRALALEPEHATALHGLGITLFKFGQHDEGITLIQKALEHRPDRVAAWFDLAVALRDAGRQTEAQTAYDRAMSILAKDGGGKAVAPLERQAFSVDKSTYDFKLVDYDYRARIRYGAGRPLHPQLLSLLQENHNRYAEFIDSMAESHAEFEAVALEGSYSDTLPFWLNTWFAPLDGMALQTMLRLNKPKMFVEIGSGVSTKFARLAKDRHQLETRMISVDPHPRNEINQLVDRPVRMPLERVTLANFDHLGPGDILFLDSSHRSFQNSDVTVFFLEILPRLRPGVIVHIHDIYLPYDYPSGHLAAAVERAIFARDRAAFR